METTVKERLKAFIEYKGLTIQQFEKLCGLSNGYVGSMVKTIGSNKLPNIIKVFPELNSGWLLTGEGTMLKSGNTVTQNNVNIGGNNVIGDNNNVGVTADGGAIENSTPLIPTAITKKKSVDVWEYMKHNTSEIQQVTLQQLFPRCDLYYRVISNAMYPSIEKGDVLALQLVPHKDVIVNGECYVVDTDSLGMMVRMIYGSGETITCKALNANYSDVIIDKSDVYNLFRIVGLVRHDIGQPASESKYEGMAKIIQNLERQLMTLEKERDMLNERLKQTLDTLNAVVTK